MFFIYMCITLVNSISFKFTHCAICRKFIFLQYPISVCCVVCVYFTQTLCMKPHCSFGCCTESTVITERLVKFQIIFIFGFSFVYSMFLPHMVMKLLVPFSFIITSITFKIKPSCLAALCIFMFDIQLHLYWQESH